MSDFQITEIEEKELPAVLELLNISFEMMHLKLSGKIPDEKKEGDRVKQRYYRKNCSTLALRDQRNQIIGVCMVQFMGSKAVIGPAAVHPQLAKNTSFFKAVLEYWENKNNIQNLKIAESVTFPNSPLHLVSHFNTFDPMFSMAFLSKPIELNDVKVLNDSRMSIFSVLSLDQQQQALMKINQICDIQFSGYILNSEIEHVINRNLGDVILINDDSQKIVGFAICHFGTESESFKNDQLLIKHLIIDKNSVDRHQIAFTILEKINQFGLKYDLREIAIMCSSAHRSSLQLLLQLGYQVTQIHSHWARCHQVLSFGTKNSSYLQQRGDFLQNSICDEYSFHEMR